MKQRIYRGSRFDNGVSVSCDGRVLNPMLHVEKIGAGNFDWGFFGDGPLQLALAICVTEFGRDVALQIYGDFADRVTSHFMRDGWMITSQQIAGFCVPLIELLADQTTHANEPTEA